MKKLYTIILLWIVQFSFAQDLYFSNYACDYSEQECNLKPLKTAFLLDQEKNVFKMYFKIKGETTPIISYRIQPGKSTDSTSKTYLCLDDNGKPTGDTIGFSFSASSATILIITKNKYTIFELLSSGEIEDW